MSSYRALTLYLGPEHVAKLEQLRRDEHVSLAHVAEVLLRMLLDETRTNDGKPEARDDA